MTFDAAMRNLVEAHVCEVAQLEAEVHRLRHLLDPLPRASGGAFEVLSETHGCPLPSQPISYASSKQAFTPKCRIRTPRVESIHADPPALASKLPDEFVKPASADSSEVANRFDDEQNVLLLSASVGDASMGVVPKTTELLFERHASGRTSQSDEAIEKEHIHLNHWLNLSAALLVRSSYQLGPHLEWIDGMKICPSGDTRLAKKLDRLEIELAFAARLERMFFGGRAFTGNMLNAFSANRESTKVVATALGQLVCHPASRRRFVWVLLSMCVMMYELIALTLSPFGFEEEKAADVMDLISACFWTIDIFMTFTSGIFVEGRVEMRPSVVAKKYLRTWFLFDVVLVTMQWYAVHVTTNISKTGFAVKLLRLLRTIRLARIKFLLSDEIFTQLMPYIDVSSVGIVSKLLIAVLSFVHCSACLWYEVGKEDGGWISVNQDTLTDSPQQNYLIALHWSFSQLQGNIDVFPGKGSGNRLFAVVSSGLSIVVLALFVSSITNALVAARQERARRQIESRAVGVLFETHKVTPALRARARHHLKCKIKQDKLHQKRLEETQALQLFPMSLRMHLLGEIRSAYVCWHPVFVYLRRRHPKLFAKICSEALFQCLSEPDQDIFACGELSKTAYFFGSGEFVLNAKFEFMDNILGWLSETRRSKLLVDDPATARRLSEIVGNKAFEIAC